MGAQRPSHHESREAVPGVQSASRAGIVIGFARFGTVPDAMIVIVQQPVTGLALNAVKKGCGRVSVRSRRHAHVMTIERFAIARHRPQSPGELVGQCHGGPVVTTPLGDLQRPSLESIQCLPAFASQQCGNERGSCAVNE